MTWHVPSRWTVLSLLSAEPDAPASAMEMIRVDQVLRSLSPEDSQLLRQVEIDWRGLFEGVLPLHPPVLGPSGIRWIWPVIEEHVRDPEQPFARACLALAASMDGVTDLYAAVVRPGYLLAFDNYEVLHRGVRNSSPSRRWMLKMKMAGRMYPPGNAA